LILSTTDDVDGLAGGCQVTDQLLRPALTDVVSPAPLPAWEQLIRQNRDSLVTQTPVWSQCVLDGGGYADASRLYRFADGESAVLPLVRSRLLPARWAPAGSWPFDWGIGGPVTSAGFGPAHARQVLEDLARRPAVRTGVRLNPLSAELWHEVAAPWFSEQEHTTYVVDLAGGFEQVWASRFRGSVRRGVRKAERSGVEVEVDHTGRLIPVFYRLYEQSIERWARQSNEPLALARLRARRANPERKFATVAARLGQACVTWVAWTAGEPAASIIVLRSGAQAKYWRGAMNHTLAAPVRANDLLHRLAIEQACEAGCVNYHMGDSRPGSSLAGFKEGFGARPMDSWSLLRERVPVTAAQQSVRTLVKRAIRFQDP
jgi:hypothetical protein